MNAPRSPAEHEILSLVQQAERATAAGQRDEAHQFLNRARAVAPEHPLVLNASGVEALHRGDASEARRFIERAIAQESGNAAFWLNLASCLRGLRGLQEPDEEMRALERALAIEPRHLLALLQKASLLNLMGKPRAAAQTYQHALQVIPPGARIPEHLRAALGRAIEAVRANDAALESFLAARVEQAGAAHRDADRSRFDHCIDALLGKRRIYTPQPTFLHFPKLPAEEFHPRERFPWLDRLEAATAEIRSELERVLSEDSAALQPYIAYPEGVPLDQWKELNHSRRWSAFYLWRDGSPVDAHLQRCPRTAELLRDAPMLDLPGYGPTAFFSVLDAGSHIPAHTGVTNTRLIVHVPLILPGASRFRVGAETREWRLGEAWVFDDSIEHEAWNDSDAPRAVLIFDIWNPYLSAAERDLVRAAAQGVKEYYAESTAAVGRHT